MKENNNLGPNWSKVILYNLQTLCTDQFLIEYIYLSIPCS